jgi:hypothetical protein
MAIGNPGSRNSSDSALDPSAVTRDQTRRVEGNPASAVIVTEVSPFHCLYQDALEFHSQSRLMLNRSESGSSRLARASLLLYVSSAEALIHQAAVELGRPDLAGFIADPSRPLPTMEAWKLLPAIVGVGSSPAIDCSITPWPQMVELLSLRTSWTYPGSARSRRAYYRASRTGGSFEPLQPHQATPAIGLSSELLIYPKTGLPRDPYALRPHHLDTTRGILDAAIEALDRKLDGALTRHNRHRRELIEVLPPIAH